MEEPEIYQHKPLSSARSIRVIILKGTRRVLFRGLFRSLPSAGDQQTQDRQQPPPLELELKEVPLDSAQSYEALSYTWDGQAPDRPIKCHGRTLRITKNCERALLRLRKKSDRCLWIDSICIDQQSVQEKNTQVPLMAEIYTKCRKVLVWLGEGTEASDRSLAYLEDILAILDTDRGILSRLSSMNNLQSAWEPAFVSEIEQKTRTRREAFRGKYLGCLVLHLSYNDVH